MEWAHILAYVTGTVDQELLAWNEYLAAENRILKAHLKGRLNLSMVLSALLVAPLAAASGHGVRPRRHRASNWVPAPARRRAQTGRSSEVWIAGNIERERPVAVAT